jgi:hypothetical protein
MQTTHGPLYLVEVEVLYIEKSLTFQVLLELFSLTEHFNVAAVRNFEVVLEQTLNYFV